jgi:tRNA threonylcarbamoyladenosine dehydratase
MKTVYDRTELLLGRETLSRLKQKKVLVFGIGGVGGFVTEALARTGIGTIGIVDYDTIDITNINRQIIAYHSTVGRLKTEVMKERIVDINPTIKVQAFGERLTAQNLEEFNLKGWDYVVDAIDDVAAKLLLIRETKTLEIPIICSMGAGNHFDPKGFQVSDIKKTHTCPLAKIIRKEVGKMGIKELKVVFSTEKPNRAEPPEECSRFPASIVFAPAAVGLIIAAEVVKDLMDGC